MISIWMVFTVIATGPGQWDNRITDDIFEDSRGNKVHYATMKPERVEEGKRYPLVLALHYGGQVTPHYGRGYLEILVAPAFEKQDWIIVAPDCPGRGWDSPEAQTLIPQLLEHLESELPIDDHRVLVGFSMGAHGVWHWADRMPGTWTAGIALSGRVPDVDVANLERMPFYVIHSRDDELIPLSRTLGKIDALRKAGVDIKLVTLSGLSHYQTAAFVPALRRTASWLNPKLER